jgi:hypothetical protein
MIIHAAAIGLTAALLGACNGDDCKQVTCPECPKCDNVPGANVSGAPKPLQKLQDDDKRTWTRALVKGQKSHLKDFDAKLIEVLGVGSLEEYEIGCVAGCDSFNTPDPLAQTVYVFPREHADLVSRFAMAWDAIQRASLDMRFKLEFDADIVTPTCTGPNNPQPCSAMPFCASDGCGRKPISSSSCAAC